MYPLFMGVSLFSGYSWGILASLNWYPPTYETPHIDNKEAGRSLKHHSIQILVTHQDSLASHALSKNLWKENCSESGKRFPTGTNLKLFVDIVFFLTYPVMLPDPHYHCWAKRPGSVKTPTSVWDLKV